MREFERKDSATRTTGPQMFHHSDLRNASRRSTCPAQKQDNFPGIAGWLTQSNLKCEAFRNGQAFFILSGSMAPRSALLYSG